MQMNTDGSNAYVLGGPAIYAALGVRHGGLPVRLLTALGNDLDDTDKAVLDCIDDRADRLMMVLPYPMIAWNSPAVLGDHGKGRLSDDPARWRVMPVSMAAIDAQPLILANADPDWHQLLLAAARPSCVFMDVHMEWLRFREKALHACMQKANVITITETEYKALPLAARSGGVFSGEDKAVIIKRGRQGVTIVAQRQQHDFPPPSPSHIGTDVGCGDLLIGLLAAHALKRADSGLPLASIDRLGQAYLDSLTELARLIESDSPSTFLQYSLRGIRAQQSGK